MAEEKSDEKAERCILCAKTIEVGKVTQCSKTSCIFKMSAMQRQKYYRELNERGLTPMPVPS